MEYNKTMYSVNIKSAVTTILGLIVGSSASNAATLSSQLATFDGQVTFNEVILPENTAVTNQFQTEGLTFSGVFYDPRNSSGSQAGPLIIGMSGATAGNFQHFGFSFSNFQNPITFSFENTVNEFSFVGFSNERFTIVEAFNNGALVESAPTVNFGEFLFSNRSVAFGFTGILFDEVRLTLTDSNALSFRFDDIRFNVATSVVPLPAALPLFGTGLAMLGFFGWRRKRAAAV